MANLRAYLLGGATLICALSVGYVMQYGYGGPDANAADADALAVTDITQTSSAAIAPRLPTDLVIDQNLPDAQVELAAAPELKLEGFDLPDEAAGSGFDCELTMQADLAAGALVDLTLTAPCNASERVTIHHQGMMFTEVMQPDGTLTVTVPALAETATFIAAFASGDGATAIAEVTSLAFYDRVVVQWKGQAGLQLHAREFESEYFSENHVWAAAAGSLSDAAKGEGGFLTRLGQSDAPDALVAEVYSFPTGTAARDGQVLLTVEAEITELNCDSSVEAQTLELRDDASLRVRDLTLDMPECDGVGDFLVLKNLVEDLKIAAR